MAGWEDSECGLSPGCGAIRPLGENLYKSLKKRTPISLWKDIRLVIMQRNLAANVREEQLFSKIFPSVKLRTLVGLNWGSAGRWGRDF